MSRTLQSLLEDARDALSRAGLTELDWTRAQVTAARRTRSGLIVGELSWFSQRVRFVCVNRSLDYLLAQRGVSWQPGLSAAFAIRLVIHRRHGFQAEVHDLDLDSIKCGPGGGG